MSKFWSYFCGEINVSIFPDVSAGDRGVIVYLYSILTTVSSTNPYIGKSVLKPS